MTSAKWYDQAVPSQSMRDAAARRQRALRARRKAAGGRQAAVWLTGDQDDALQKKYPGINGGIDWEEVITAALEKKR